MRQTVFIKILLEETLHYNSLQVEEVRMSSVQQVLCSEAIFSRASQCAHAVTSLLLWCWGLQLEVQTKISTVQTPQGRSWHLQWNKKERLQILNDVTGINFEAAQELSKSGCLNNSQRTILYNSRREQRKGRRWRIIRRTNLEDTWYACCQQVKENLRCRQWRRGGRNGWPVR